MSVYDHMGTLRELSISSGDEEEQEAVEWALAEIVQLKAEVQTLHPEQGLQDVLLTGEIRRLKAALADHPGLTCREAQELINAYRGEMDA